MASVNRKVKVSEFTAEGAPAIVIAPIAQLERSVMSCLLWEDEFYEDGKKIADRICDLVKQCKPEDVAALAVRAKNDMKLRHVPLLLVRELARTKEGRKQLKDAIPHVVNRVDDITELLAIYLSEKKATRGPAKLPNQLKKHLALTFEKFNEYQLGKYRGEKKSVSLKDAIRLTHPKSTNPEFTALWGKVLKDELATPDTWEVELSQSKDKKASWTRLLNDEKLGGLAMLRNIRNMREAGIEDSLIKDGIQGIYAGRLLPINFISAAVHNPQFEPELEAKFLECFEQKEKIGGKTVLLVDVSGSMEQKLSGKGERTRMDVAFSLAMIARETFTDLRVFSFSDNRVEVPGRRGFALRDAIQGSQDISGTDLGGALQDLPQHDRLIVITDEQSQSCVPQMNGYMINVASNKNGVGYHQWTHIDGWSDKVISYILQSEKLRANAT